jgi:hypothetical protein
VTKIQITCSRCGFVGFVDQKAVMLEAGGWRLSDLAPEVSGVCPACIAEEAPEPPAKMTA